MHVQLPHAPPREWPIRLIFVSCLNFDPHPSLIGENDYAGCAGDGTDWTVWGIPASLAQGDSWTGLHWHVYGDSTTTSGVICRRSMTKIIDIPDGTSNTYLCGEKSLDPDYYFIEARSSAGDGQGWDLGYDFDVARWTTPNVTHYTDFFHPRQDQPGADCYCSFGSAHAVGFHMAFCDGSVHMLNYSIDPKPTAGWATATMACPSTPRAGRKNLWIVAFRSAKVARLSRSERRRHWRYFRGAKGDCGAANGYKNLLAGGLRIHTRSTARATASPPPMHSEAMPERPLRSAGHSTT